MRWPRFSRTIIGFPFFRYWVTIRRQSAHPPLYTERHRIGFRPLLAWGDWQLAVRWTDWDGMAKRRFCEGQTFGQPIVIDGRLGKINRVNSGGCA